MSIARMRGRCCRRAVLGAWIVACVGPTAAMGQSGPDAVAPLDLRQAVSRTLDHHPSLRLIALREQGLAGEGQTAALKPISRVGIEVENIAGSGAASGVDAVETTLALSSVVELGGKRRARVAIVDARRSLLDAERRVLALDVIADVANRFSAVAVLQARLDLARNARGLAQTAVPVVEDRVQAGASPMAELRRARVELAQADIEVTRHEQQLSTARRALAAAWGADAVDFGPVSAALFALRPAGALEPLLVALEDNPHMRSLASEERVQEAELRLVVAQGRSDFDWTVGLRHLQDSGDVALVGGVGLTLGTERRNRGLVAAAEARRSELPLRRDAALRRFRVQLIGLHGQQRAAVNTVKLLQEQVIPELRQALGETREAYDRGRYSYLEWVAARRELVAAQRAAIDAVAAAHRARLEIERLTGEPLLMAAASRALEVEL